MCRGPRCWLFALCAVTGLAWLGWGWLQPQEGASVEAAAAPSRPATVQPVAQATPGAAPYSPAGLAARERQLKLWQQRYERAEEVYRAYRDATRLPPHSRPLYEHPDQARPFDPVTDEAPLRDPSGRPVAGVRLRTTQDKVFVSGTEAVRFTLEALDAEGRRLPLAMRRSFAQSLPDTRALATAVHAQVAFTDDGAGADDAAGDGRYAARMIPAEQGFAGRAGTIRVLAEVLAGGQQGLAAFDVVYTPDLAGSWGGVRESTEGGGLSFYVQAQVQLAGRYVASGRVYDAKGTPVALLQFNEMLPAGPVEFKLSLAGLLLHEARPAFPLRLVDVEAFLLRPDTFPDRVMMPRWPGVVHVSAGYPLETFSSEEWSSEQRDRHLQEYARDVVRAEDELSRLRR